MKSEPTDIDREAARLFSPARGMFAWTDLMGPGFPPFCGTVLGVDDEGFARVIADDGSVHSRGRVVALDTDDDATVGVMVAQVRAAGRPAFSTRSVLNGDSVRIWRSDGADGWYETEGASVVAEMRALKGKP